MSEHTISLDIEKIAQDVQTIRFCIENNKIDSAMRYLDHFEALIQKSLCDCRLKKLEEKNE